MRGKHLAAAVIAVLLAGGAGGAAAQDARPGEAGKAKDFSFYGIHFRMTREQVRAIVPLDEAGKEVLKPQHGMMFLSFGYDYQGRLMELRAAYPRTDDSLADEGLRRALRERFVQPITSAYRNLSVQLDEFSNRSAIVLVILSNDIKEEAINHFKEEALKKMD